MTKSRSLLYVSVSRIPADAVETTVQRIVTEAITHNGTAHITGALMFTGHKFAQIIEGSDEAIEELLQRLLIDRHHRDLLVLRDEHVAQRQFASWQLAYAGPAAFVVRTVDRALEGAAGGSERAIDGLVKMMAEFSGYS